MLPADSQAGLVLQPCRHPAIGAAPPPRLSSRSAAKLFFWFVHVLHEAGSERVQFRAGHLGMHPPCTVYELLAPAWKNITASCTWIVLAASGARYLVPSPSITWPWGLITFSEGSSPYSGLRTYQQQQQQQQPPTTPILFKRCQAQDHPMTPMAPDRPTNFKKIFVNTALNFVS